MSYLALATLRFDEMVEFYGRSLWRPLLRSWDRPDGRGCVFDLSGIRLEILDAVREKNSMQLPPPGDRFHLVLEVLDIDAAQRALRIETPEPVTTSWGARMFTVRDPDGIAVCYLQWLRAEADTRGYADVPGQSMTSSKMETSSSKSCFPCTARMAARISRGEPPAETVSSSVC